MPSGVKTYFTVVGNGKRHTIGRVGEVSLAAARDTARRIRAEKTLGRYQRHPITWDAGRRLFLDHVRGKNKQRTYVEYERLTGRFRFHGFLHDITKHEAARKIASIHAPSERDHALVALRIFFRWAMSRGYLESDPTAGLKKAKASAHARLLTDAEIRLIWQNTEEPTHFNCIVRLLICTGARRNEIASLRAEYIKDHTCILPASLTKNGREHVFPLSSLAVSILPKQNTGLLFPARGNSSTSFSGWSKSKKALDSRLWQTVGKWNLHLLRHYFASTMARLSVKQEVTERLLNHRSGIISGIAAVYQHHDFWDDMVHATSLYDEHIRAIIA